MFTLFSTKYSQHSLHAPKFSLPSLLLMLTALTGDNHFLIFKGLFIDICIVFEGLIN